MKILFSGDVAWNTGREAFEISLPFLRHQYGAFDFVLMNCENAAHGKGMTDNIFNKFIAMGVDAMTSGNHIWDKPAFFPTMDAENRVFRPANYPDSCPGIGYGVIERKGKKLGVINLQGQVFMPPIDSPFYCADKIISELKAKHGENLPIFVDFHAEATSEKQALAYYLDGRVSAVIGTHTHVQTADERVLPNGTAFMCDAGMTGGHGGLLGCSLDSVMPKFLQGLPCRFEPCIDEPAFNGVIIYIDDSTGLAENIKRINIPLEIDLDT
ncbi:MAG: YmdB family metallophosphoesterase [Synergistaceae bacterium]|nr:YmdB family metallophosphoesterase [Synergistaceae bacterium]MBQ9595197.1 YmdB family metallophosphoesterase [Synergistaceae bacterium]